MSGAPAWVHNDRLDFLAANRLGFALYSEFFTDAVRPANSARCMFLNPRSRDFYPIWNSPTSAWNYRPTPGSCCSPTPQSRARRPRTGLKLLATWAATQDLAEAERISTGD